jgi:hypothetical protein
MATAGGNAYGAAIDWCGRRYRVSAIARTLTLLSVITVNRLAGSASTTDQTLEVPDKAACGVNSGHMTVINWATKNYYYSPHPAPPGRRVFRP